MTIWERLMNTKLGDCEITEHDKEMLEADIKGRQEAGWSDNEIYLLLRWTEYFNNVDSEDFCLRKMAKMNKQVAERLGLSPLAIEPKEGPC